MDKEVPEMKTAAQDAGRDLIKILLYIVLTYALTWLTWLSTDNPAIEIIGSCMPSIVGLILLLVGKETAGIGKRMISFKAIRSPWHWVIFLSMPLVTLLAYVTQMLLGGATPSLNTFLINLNRPYNMFLFLLLGMGAGLGEELGWRAFLLEKLQKRWSPLVSSLIVGLIWALWHTPLAVLNGEKLLSLSFMNYCISVMLLSVMMTLIYNANGRSLLAAILFHGMVNATQYILFLSSEIPLAMSIHKTFYLLILVLFILEMQKRKRLHP